MINAKFIIRNFEPTDSDLLKELERLCPQGNRLSFCTDMTGDYHAKANEFTLSCIRVAHVQNDAPDPLLVGVSCAAMKIARFGGAMRKCCYYFGTRVHPDYRRQGIAKALYLSVEKWALAGGAELVYADIVRDNHGIYKMLRDKLGFEIISQHKGKGFPVQPKERPVPEDVTVTQVRRERALTMLEKQCEKSEYGVSSEDLQSLVNHAAYQCTLRATRDDSEASLSVWRTESILAAIPVEVPTWIRVAVGLINRTSRFLPTLVPFVPIVKGVRTPQRSAFGMDMSGPGGAELLRVLFSVVHNLCKRDGIDLIYGWFHEDEPFIHSIPAWSMFDVAYYRMAKPLCEELRAHPQFLQTKGGVFYDPREA